MLIFFNKNNKDKLHTININYKKIKINNYFLNSKFIIYINLSNNFIFKNKIINYDLYSLILKENYIKSLFNIFHFSFLRNNNYLCIFINNIITFINVIILLENKLLFFSYKNS